MIVLWMIVSSRYVTYLVEFSYSYYGISTLTGIGNKMMMKSKNGSETGGTNQQLQSMVCVLFHSLFIFEKSYIVPQSVFIE